MTHITSAVLRTHGITFALWSGMHASFIGQHRVSQDVDLWVADRDMKKVEGIFHEVPLFVGNNDRRIVRLGDQDEIEIMSHMDIHTSDGVIPLRLTKAAQARIRMHQFGAWRLPCVDPADTILLKAILQRGKDQGKHDIEDIEAIKRNALIDSDYLRFRVHEASAGHRVHALLQSMQLI